MVSMIFVPAEWGVGLWLQPIAVAVTVALVLVGPWPRPVTRFRRIVSALVVLVLLSGALVATVKQAGTFPNYCDSFGGGWWTSICEWMP